MLGAKHAAERFDACWHGGLATIEALRGQMGALLDEYLAGGDLKEAERCLQGLAVPHFHHDFVTRRGWRGPALNRGPPLVPEGRSLLLCRCSPGPRAAPHASCRLPSALPPLAAGRC